MQWLSRRDYRGEHDGKHGLNERC